MKTVLNKDAKYLIKDITRDFHCEYGVISKDVLSLTRVRTNKDCEFSVFDACFIDKYEKIRRRAQIITLKDIGLIISNTGINKDSVILEAGSGSGALTCFLANIAKHVFSYDIREEHQIVAKENALSLSLSNITFKNGDIREGVDEKDIDLVVLDIPDPWLALSSIICCLKRGGHLVVYSPTIPQIIDTVNAIKHTYNRDLLVVNTFENIMRPWEIDDRKVRPVSSYINHTAFLCFVRRI